MADRCDCFLPTDPPDDGSEWWQPTLDDEPDDVKAVARVGEDPTLRRAVRRADGSGWSEEGALVNFYREITPPMPWNRVGWCWAEMSHPVVACEPWPL
ncbi:MAG: hypothetical protein ACRDQ0_08025 [Pseudonocardia sp.]